MKRRIEGLQISNSTNDRQSREHGHGVGREKRGESFVARQIQPLCLWPDPMSHLAFSFTRCARPGASFTADPVSAPGVALSDPALILAYASHMLVLTTRLVEAGAALGEMQLVGEFVWELLHELCAWIRVPARPY